MDYKVLQLYVYMAREHLLHACMCTGLCMCMCLCVGVCDNCTLHVGMIVYCKYVCIYVYDVYTCVNIFILIGACVYFKDVNVDVYLTYSSI